MMVEIVNQFQQGLAVLQEKTGMFFSFIGGKLHQYQSLTLGEQISYPAIGLGLLLVLISVVLFIL